MKQKTYFCHLSDLKIGVFLIKSVGKFSIGATLFEGQPLLILNACPHANAPICRGMVVHFFSKNDSSEQQATTDLSLLRCPWHGWEFSLKTGKTLFDSPLKLRFFHYEILDEKILIEI